RHALRRFRPAPGLDHLHGAQSVSRRARSRAAVLAESAGAEKYLPRRAGRRAGAVERAGALPALHRAAGGDASGPVSVGAAFVQSRAGALARRRRRAGRNRRQRDRPAVHDPRQLSGHRPGDSSRARQRAAVDRRRAGDRLHRARRALRKPDSPGHDPVDSAIGRRRRLAGADPVPHRIERDRADRNHSADRHRQEKRHHDDRLRARRRAQRKNECRRRDLSCLPAALSADPDDDPGGAPRRPAACSRRRRRLRAAPPARHRDRRRADLQPDADPLHHAGHLSLSGTLPGILRGFAAKQTAAADRGFGVKKMCRATVPIVLAWVLPWLSACSVGPDYARPALKTPPAYKESPAAAESRAIDDVITRKWWEIFADPQLNALEEQVEVSNQNIAQAEARFRQARALVQQTRAAYFPTVTVGAGITRIAPSATAGSSTARANQTFTERSLPVDVSWELDLWGRIRRSVESSRALAQASEADLEAARLSARAELAQ